MSNIRQAEGGNLIVSGWALTSASRWLLTFHDQDDKSINGEVRKGIPRADVANNFPQYYNEAAGWEFEISSGTFKKLKEIKAQLFTEDGSASSIHKVDAGKVKPLPGQPVVTQKALPSRLAISRIEIDNRADEAIISGWVLTEADRWFITLRNQLGQVLNGRLTKGIYRADIAYKMPQYFDENSGWEFRVPLSEYRSVEKLTAELMTDAGTVKAHKDIDPQQVRQVNAAQAPRFALSSAQVNEQGDTLTLSGWRLVSGGRSLIIVRDANGNAIDGEFTYGLRRSNVAARFPSFYDTHSGWEFKAKVGKSQRTPTITAELVTETGNIATSKEVNWPKVVEKNTAPPEASAISIVTAQFNPQRRHILAEGKLERGLSVSAVEITSSAGRIFSQTHLKSLPTGKDGLRRWQFQTPCSGLEEGESLIAAVKSKGDKAIRLIEIKETSAFSKLSRPASLAPDKPRLVDIETEATLAAAEAFATSVEARPAPLKTSPGTVTYFPPFAAAADLTNHYHRAAWYLTGAGRSIEQVTMALRTPDLKVGEKPPYFGDAMADNGNIRLIDADDAYYEALVRARLIFVWQALPAEALARLRKLGPGCQVMTVGTDDLESTEYGNYCRAQWMALGKPERDALLADSQAKFRARLEQLRAEGKEAAVVFGTGPSIDKAFDYDFSKCLTVVCNTSVADDELLDHIKPAFVCAGDVVSHFGVSAYAERFRADLVKALKERDLLFFTSAAFGFLLSAKFPEIKDKIIFCDQRHQGANIDLDAIWSLPRLDSTLNIHMLPIAATFSDLIFVLGCDGKNPDPEKNEDFWAHSAKTHYHDLVDTGHQSHPTFDARRQTSTFSRYLDSAEESCQAGELAGKMYFSLEPSFTPALKARPVPGHFMKPVKGKKQLTRQSQAKLQVVDKPLRVLIVSKCAPHLFSGGRYHAAMIAEALAQRGHDIVMWFDNKPYWWSYLALNPNHDRIRFWINDFDESPAERFDVVFVIPDSSSDPKAYMAALECAQFSNAKVILLNFESPNWYNELSPEPRDPSLWTFWHTTSTFSDAILSSARESTRYALDYYDTVQPHTVFVDAPPSINTYAADLVAGRHIEPRKQVICISRFGSFAKHKNIDAVLRLIPSEMSGYTLALVVGTAPLPPADELEAFENKLKRKGVKLRILHGISDVEKFEEIAKSKLMIFQSSFEGFGYPPIEAQYMGRPCVAFDLPVLREFSEGNISFIERGNYRAFRDEVGRILTDFTPQTYVGLKAAIAPTAAIPAFSDRLQSILDTLATTSDLAVDAYDESAFHTLCEAHREALKLSAETPAHSSQLPLHIVQPEVTPENVDMADVRKYVRAALQKAPDDTPLELIELISSTVEPGRLTPVLKNGLKPETWLQPDIFTAAASVEDAAQRMTAAAAARSLLASCNWALPRTFDRSLFMANAINMCQTYDQTLGLLRRQLRNKEGLLALKDASLRPATEQDLPVLFDEIILRRSYYFATNNPAPYILDGGANFGLATYGFLQQYPDAQIVAFEPGRAAARALKENAENNGWRNVTVRQVALAAEEGVAYFNEPQHMSMGGSLTNRLKDSAYAMDSYEVPTIPLSRFIDRPVDLLKLDIEGAEMPVLEEIRNHLDKVRRIFIEVHATEGHSSLESVDHVVRQLSAAGFGCYCEPAKASASLNKFNKNGAGSYVVWAAK
ncbi:MAG: FkbM family methyltransferase [Asticcacaulis sp.]|nr:FkbM family methyltransferase [Asticcacaulis sp.]